VQPKSPIAPYMYFVPINPSSILSFSSPPHSSLQQAGGGRHQPPVVPIASPAFLHPRRPSLRCSSCCRPPHAVAPALLLVGRPLSPPASARPRLTRPSPCCSSRRCHQPPRCSSPAGVEAASPTGPRWGHPRQGRGWGWSPPC
jgi:hypothetical protein